MYHKTVTCDQSAYNLALRDFAKVPKVKSMYTEGYTGRPGSIIVVWATDDFKVISVKVSIYSPAGNILEEGEAAINDNGLDWTYTASVINDEVVGSSIKAIALDTPGNRGSLEVTV